MEREEKRRTEKVRKGDRHVEKRVSNGKKRVKVRLVRESARGKKWGEFVTTRSRKGKSKGKGGKGQGKK
jgi:ribosomal protein S19